MLQVSFKKIFVTNKVPMVFVIFALLTVKILGCVSNAPVIRPDESSQVRITSSPERNYLPKKLLNIILAIIMGTVGSLGLAFFSEFMDYSFTTGTDFEEKLDMPLLASIQEFKPLH